MLLISVVIHTQNKCIHSRFDVICLMFVSVTIFSEVRILLDDSFSMVHISFWQPKRSLKTNILI